MLIVLSKIREKAKKANKRVSHEYLTTLSDKVGRIVEDSIQNAKLMTLKAEDVR